MTYKNGNHLTTIYNDGTRIRRSKDKYFTYDFPENIDIKINNRCDFGCPFCHEGSEKDGKLSDLSSIIKNKKSFIYSLQPGTEVAIGGGNIFESLDLFSFLKTLKDLGIIVNITVKYAHAIEHCKKLSTLSALGIINGIGISMPESYVSNELLETIDSLGNNVVLHYIAGIATKDSFNSIHNRKILFLGYKELRRGVEYKQSHKVEEKIEELKNSLNDISKDNVLCFDELALNQLDVKKVLNITDKEYDLLYQGNDESVVDNEGNIITPTMYIDLVENKVARMSTAPFDKRRTFDPLNSDIRELFKLSIEDYR